MNNGKVRIYELAKELNLDNRDLLTICEQLNISVKSHSSTITETEAEQIRAASEKFTANRPSAKPSPVRPTINASAVDAKKPTPLNIQKKQQILEIRRPITRSAAAASGPDLLSPPAQSPPAQPTQELSRRPACRRTPRTGQGYIEPLLEVGNALPLYMVLIPAGEFIMGSPTNELQHQDTESPQHLVTVPQFFMGRYPITQAQWRVVAGLSPVKQKLAPEPSQFKDKDNHPVESVSWHDAIEFCARLERDTNRPYRLPTEAEWEYACRAGTTTPFYFGKTLTDELANYNASATYGKASQGEYRQTTTPVDHFGIANAFGLSDMHGNVQEWCQDHGHDNYEGAPTDGSTWLTNNENARRVLRGGSWYFDPRHCRSATRDLDAPDDRTHDIGFRVVCSAP